MGSHGSRNERQCKSTTAAARHTPVYSKERSKHCLGHSGAITKHILVTFVDIFQATSIQPEILHFLPTLQSNAVQMLTRLQHPWPLPSLAPCLGSPYSSLSKSLPLSCLRRRCGTPQVTLPMTVTFEPASLFTFPTAEPSRPSTSPKGLVGSQHLKDESLPCAVQFISN